MTKDRKALDRQAQAGRETARGSSDARGGLDAFLREAAALAPVKDGARRGRLIFALDATMSRQPTWDAACSVQAQMFETTAQAAALTVQLVYFRGFNECRASRWVVAPRALADLMTRIDCRGGHTQIGRVLRHVRAEAGKDGVAAFVYVGDAMEENVDDLCAVAGELGLLGVKGFFFHEGADPVAGGAFREMARLTGGAYAQFDSSAPATLAELLRAAAAYATGGAAALERLASGSVEARGLLTSMRPRG